MFKEGDRVIYLYKKPFGHKQYDKKIITLKVPSIYGSRFWSIIEHKTYLFEISNCILATPISILLYQRD